MKNVVIAMVLAVVSVAQPVQAAIQFDVDGRVSHVTNYDGPSLTAAEVLGLGAAMAVGQNVGNVYGVAGAAGAVIAWGAWRTAKYRPQATKDQIHASMLAKSLEPKAGTLGELLNR